jgi:undecaprenyl-diphosphatase
MSISAIGDLLETIAIKFDDVDTALCTRLNRSSRQVSLRFLFRAVSRLGDGIVWYTLLGILPLIGGHDGFLIAAQMALTALVGLAVYKIMKHVMARERPYINHTGKIECALPPLDRYSFPSGHTLHAVSFSVILCSYLPELAWVLVPFAVLIALSRMVLGLHYPTDVLAGALIGGGLALLSFDVVTLVGY